MTTPQFPLYKPLMKWRCKNIANTTAAIGINQLRLNPPIPIACSKRIIVLVG